MTTLFKTTFITPSAWQIGIAYKRNGPPLKSFGSAEYVDQPQYNILVAGNFNFSPPKNCLRRWKQLGSIEHDALRHH